MNEGKKILQRIIYTIKKPCGKEVENSEEKLLIEEVHKALMAWRNSEQYFQNVTDPQLIDYAIYKMDAAIERYTYLIRLAKEKGIKSKWEIMK